MRARSRNGCRRDCRSAGPVTRSTAGSRDPGNLNNMLCGSEGTLAAIFSAELKIVPLPREKGLGLVFFASVAEAMQATVELLELKPSAIEHIDRPLFDQTKGQLAFRAGAAIARTRYQAVRIDPHRRVLRRRGGTAGNCWPRSDSGLRTTICTKPARDESRLGDAQGRAVAADRPQRRGQAGRVHRGRGGAPGAVAGLRRRAANRSCGRSDLEVCYYGHAATGLLHVRPVLDLHTRR